RCYFFVEPVRLFRATERYRAFYRIPQVELSLHRCVPGRGLRVLKIGHVNLRSRVESVDHHLGVPGGACDLDATILEVGRRWRELPVTAPHARGLREKVRQ